MLLCILPVLFGSQSACSEKLKTDATHPLTGTWLLQVNSTDIGAVRTVMTIEAGNNAFEGHTRENADKSLIGFPRAMLGRVFTDFFEHGALLHFEDGVYKKLSENEFRVAARFTSASGKLLFQGTLKGNLLEGRLTNGKKEDKGSITGTKGTYRLPLQNNYREIAEQALALTKTKIFNTNLVQTKDWQAFEKSVLNLSEKVQDDAEMVFGFYYYAGKLPFSHFALYRKTNNPEDLPEDTSKVEFLDLKDVNPATTLLTIRSFAGNGNQLDSVFALIKKAAKPNLIIDLRGNSGGNISGLKLVTNLTDKAYPGGVFLTNKWFKTHSNPPTENEVQQFTTLSEANLELLWDGIHNLDGLGIRVIPEKTVYQGKVFVLVDNATASTCEPIVYGLKHYKLATIIGEKTAGAMLNGEAFGLNEQWHITIPTADYYTPNGKRLDQVGVEPDIKVSFKDALDYVLKNLVKPV